MSLKWIRFTGGGFLLFTQSDNNPGIYADDTARDVYFAANPADLARLDDNEFLIIKILDNGSGQIAYQQRQNSVFVDVTSLVQGEAGPPGATANSFFFTSEAARDAFFTSSPGLLETDLPVMVNEVGTVTVFVWTGADSPPVYDAELFRPSSLGSAPGSLSLGIDGYKISSGGRVLDHKDAYGVDAFTVLTRYDPTGSQPPSTHQLSPIGTTDYANFFPDTLSDPQTMQFIPVEDVLIHEFIIRPATAGELRFQAFAGTLDTGPILIDTTITVSVAQINTIISIPTGNQLLMFEGDFVLLKFSGIQLRGGFQSAGQFIGQTVPQLASSDHKALQIEVATFGADNGLVFPDGSVQSHSSSPDGFKFFAETITPNSSQALNVGNTQPSGIAFTADGSQVFVTQQNSSIYQYDLSVPWDITTITFIANIVVVEESSRQNLWVNHNASRLWMLGGNSDAVHEYNMTTPGDITTLVFSGISIDLSPNDPSPRILTFSADLKYFFMMGTNASIFKYELPKHGTIANATYTGDNFSVASQDNIPFGIAFTPDGLRMFMMGVDDIIYQYNLKTPYDITSSLFTEQSDFLGGNIRGLFVRPDGQTIYGVDQTTDNIVSLNFGLKVPGKIIAPGNSFNGPNTFEIHSAAEWEALAVAGVITISVPTTIKILAIFTTTSVIDMVGGDLIITGDNNEDATIVYAGSGTFITVTGDFVFRSRASVVFTATGSGTFISATGVSVLAGGVDLIDTTLVNWPDLGTITRGFFNLINTPLVNYSAPFKLVDSFVTGTISSVFGGVAVDLSWNDPTYSLDSSVNVNGFLSNTALTRVSAFIPENARVLVPVGTTGSPNVAVFDTSGGSTGAYTLVADQTLASTLITAIADDGSGNASFTIPSPPFPGQIVTISGFIVNTAYNGTFKTTSSGGGVFEVEDLSTGAQVQFGTNEASVGSVEAEGIALVVSSGHGLSVGDKVQLSSNLSTRYDGGYEVWGVFPTSFRVSATYVDTQTGTWDTSPLDQTNPNVLAFEVVDNPSSHYIACGHVNDNSTVNGAIVNNTFTAMVFGTVGNAIQQSTTTERWKLVDEIAGVFEYTGNEPFDSAISFDFTVVSSGGTVDFRFKWEIDTGGGFGNLPDDVEALIAVGSDAQSVTKKFPLKAVKGDQIRPRITRNSGGSGITTLYATIFAGA